MMKYQKLYLAVWLFIMTVYGFFVSFKLLLEDINDFYGRVIVICSVLMVFVVNWIVVDAEGTNAYHVARRRQLENWGLRRALKIYASGFDDGGALAKEILEKRRKSLKPEAKVTDK